MLTNVSTCSAYPLDVACQLLFQFLLFFQSHKARPGLHPLLLLRELSAQEDDIIMYLLDWILGCSVAIATAIALL